MPRVGAIALPYVAANEATVAPACSLEERSIYTFREMRNRIPARNRSLRPPRTLSFLLIACAALLGASESWSQELPQAPKPQTGTAAGKVSVAAKHSFWDGTNGWLFAGTGAARTLDYFSTLNMRRRGRQEIFLTNDAVDNHAAFAAIEVAGTGVSIGAAYLFHRTGHHKLERWTSIVHISAATTGAVRNYCLKTAHPAPATAP